MSEPQPRTDKRPRTPDERSNVEESGNPIDASPKFEVGAVAWITVGRKTGEITIAARKKDESGKFVYQVREKEGVLYKSGEWVQQDKLSEF